MITRRNLLLSLSICLAMTLMTGICAAEPAWSQFRGVDATYSSAEKIVPEKLTEASYRWTLDMPGLGHSSPVFFDGKIITTSEVEDKMLRQVICVDADTGQVVWTHEEPYAKTVGHHGLNSYAASTPTVDDRGIYVSWISGDDFIIFSLDHEGKERWRHEIPCGFASKFGPGSSPILVDDIVIMTNEHAGEKCFLIGINAASGEIAWQTDRNTGLASYATPQVYQPVDGPLQLLFASTQHGVVSFDPKTGKINWEVPCDFTYKVCASPIIAKGVVFVSAGRGSAGQETAAIRLPDITKGEKAEIIYRTRARLPYVPTPMPIGNTFVLWNDAGVVTGIKAATGQSLWEGRVSGTYFSSPLLIDGKLYNINRDGKWVGIATDRFEVLHELQLPEGAHSTPAIVDGRIYIRTYNKLLCIEN